MSTPLQGKHVLLTRQARRVRALRTRLERLGARVSVFSALRIERCAPDPDTLRLLARADWAIFASANAVRTLAQAVDDLAGTLPDQVAAIGPATAAALARAGIPVALTAPEPHNSEALLGQPAMRSLRDASVVLVRGQGGRTLLAQTLSTQGNRVHALEVYRRAPPNRTLSFDRLAHGAPDIICIASTEAASYLVACTLQRDQKKLLACPVIAGGERIAQQCGVLGFGQVRAADHPGDDAMLRALTS